VVFSAYTGEGGPRLEAEKEGRTRTGVAVDGGGNIGENQVRGGEE